MEQIRLIKEMRERDRRDGRTGSDVFPRFMVWENVFGAFSSNNGEDFRAVLEETARIAEPGVSIPRYEGGRWTNAGTIIGDGWSMAWRTHDAQYWGVPQRRRRISLVADFGGESAPEILFESESLSGDPTKSGETRERIAGNAETCAYPTVAGTLKARYDGSPNPDIKSGQEIVVQVRGVGIKCLNPDDSQSERVYDETGIWHSLSANSKGGQSRDAVFAFKLGNGAKARSIGFEEELSPTLNAECGGNKPAICIQGNCIDRADTAGCNGRGWRDDDISYTLNTIDRPAVMAFSQNGSGDTTVHPKCNAITANQNPSGRGTAMVFGFQPQAGGNTGCAIMEGKSPCLGTTQKPAVYDARGNGDGETAPTLTGDHQNRITDYTAICYGTDSPEIAGTLDASYYKGVGARNGNERTVVEVDCRNGTENVVNGTLQAKPGGGSSVNLQNVCRTGMVVRRLTPLECERLQAFPDHWTDIGEWTDEKGKKHAVSDSSRYRALGNSIALPFWYWLLRRIMALCREKTMGSLFDGIGGFPLCWNAAGGETLWSSEIEPFCIAVTKKHFGDEDAGVEGDWKEYVPGAAERRMDEV